MKTLTMELTEEDLSAMMRGYQESAAQSEITAHTRNLSKAKREAAAARRKRLHARYEELMDLLCEHFPDEADAA